MLLGGALLRFACQFTFRPWWCGDSAGYSAPFYLWLHHAFSDAGRTPVYPLFLALGQWLSASKAAVLLSAPAALVVTWMQNLLGVATAVLVYHLLRALGVAVRTASIAATGFALVVAVCRFEMMVLTFSLSMFTLTLGAWLLVRAILEIGRGSPGQAWAVVAGGTFGVAGLVRADNLVFFAVAVGLCAWHALRLALEPAQRPLAVRLARGCLWLPLGAAPWIFAWMTVNYIGLGQFRLTTILGYQNTQAVYNLWDRVEPRDQVLGGIMTKYYRLTNSPGAKETAFVWQANPEIQSRAMEMPVVVLHPAMRHIDVGDYLGQVSRRLAARFPGIWLKNAATSFWQNSFDFHYADTSPGERVDPVAVDGAEVIKRPSLWRGEVWLAGFEAPGLLVCYLLTLVWAAGGFVALVRAGAAARLEDVAVTALALGTVGTFVTFCLVESFHNQYSEPHLAVLVVCAGYTCHRFSARGRAPVPSEKC